MTTQRKTRWAWTLSTLLRRRLPQARPRNLRQHLHRPPLVRSREPLRPLSRLTLSIATALAALLITSAGIPASTITASESSRKDPGFVVIDEVAGQLFALILSPPNWPHAALALLLFRLFDIGKPWPIRRLEALPTGTGIMLDDVPAGLLALLTGLLLSYLHHRF